MRKVHAHFLLLHVCVQYNCFKTNSHVSNDYCTYYIFTGILMWFHYSVFMHTIVTDFSLNLIHLRRRWFIDCVWTLLWGGWFYSKWNWIYQKLLIVALLWNTRIYLAALWRCIQKVSEFFGCVNTYPLIYLKFNGSWRTVKIFFVLLTWWDLLNTFIAQIQYDNHG